MSRSQEEYREMWQWIQAYHPGLPSEDLENLGLVLQSTCSDPIPTVIPYVSPKASGIVKVIKAPKTAKTKKTAKTPKTAKTAT